MPQYNWIQTPEFETSIRQRLEARFAEAAVTGMPYTFTGELVRIARENRPILESRAAEPDRPLSAALTSVDDIANTAISIARAANRTTVTQEDLTAAIQAR